MRTLDKTKVSSIQGVVGGGALDILHGIEEHALKSFVEGLALGIELVGQQPHGTLLRRPHGTLLRRPHGFSLRRPRGALDMLHRNKEHALISLHVD